MPDFQLAKLQQVIGQIDRQVDAAGDAFRGQLEQASRVVRGNLASLVRARTGEKGQITKRPTFSATGTARAMDPFIHVNARAIASLAQMADKAGQVLRVAGEQAKPPADLVRAVATLLGVDLADQLDRVIADVYGIVQRGQAIAQASTQVMQEVDEALAAYVTYSRSAYDTALMTFTQSLVTTGTDPVDAYVYLGPIDARIRPFCLKTVGTVWTRDRIDAMDNGISPNTFLRRGGPNCRHLWVPAPASMAQYINTGQVVDKSLMDDLAFAGRDVRVRGVRRTA